MRWSRKLKGLGIIVLKGVHVLGTMIITKETDGLSQGIWISHYELDAFPKPTYFRDFLASAVHSRCKPVGTQQNRFSKHYPLLSQVLGAGMMTPRYF
jgi:glycine/D-amino acid oxidase-like deaminating enzyme